MIWHTGKLISYSFLLFCACMHDNFGGNYWGFSNLPKRHAAQFCLHDLAWQEIDLILFSHLIKLFRVQGFSMLWHFLRKLLMIFKFTQTACWSVLPAWFGIIFLYHMICAKNFSSDNFSWNYPRFSILHNFTIPRYLDSVIYILCG